MKRLVSLVVMLIVFTSVVLNVSAAGSNVTYDDNAKQFIFAPGSVYSPTDLFENFKGVMPGDSLTQQITVKNNAKNNVKVKIYMRSLGAHVDSVDFLSQLSLKVKKSEQNDMAYMFDATAEKSAQLTDWVCLGTLYSGGVVNLDVVLDVPVTLDNQYKNIVGYLDWEFKIEEFPVEPTDPKPPQTGNIDLYIWCGVMAVSFISLVILMIVYKKKKENEEQY